MGVKITSVAIKNELRTESVDWLLANVGDKITVELEFTVETTIIASLDNPIILNAQDGYVGVNWIVDPLARFTDIKVNDSLYLYNYKTSTAFLGNPYQVLEKKSDSEIRVSNIGTLSGLSADTPADYILISLIKPITAVKYKYNFIENDDQPTFESKVDGTEQLLTATGLDASDVVTVVPMNFIGSKPYQIGSATIKGNGVSTTTGYQYKFKVVHTAFITPFILATQVNNMLNNVAPDYYFNQKCLKGIFDIEAAFLLTDPNYLQTEQITETKGNTGWFDENFNTGLTNYKIKDNSSTNVVYKKLDLSTINSIQLSTDETIVEVTIKNTVDSPFSNNNTKFVLNFCKVPADESEYVSNTLTQKENFIFDRKLQTLGSAAVNGDNYGADYQVLKEIAATFISTSEIKLTFKIAMSSVVLQQLNLFDEKRFLLWVTIQKHTLATSISDKVALKIDSQLFAEDFTDDAMIGNTTIALRHPENNRLTEGIALGGAVSGSPAFINWTQGASPATDWAIVDATNGKTIGVAAFTTDLNTTFNKLVQSINTNTALGTIFSATGYGIIPAFDNSAGYTATWNGSVLKVTAPSGSGTTYNGTAQHIVSRYYGYSTGVLGGGIAGSSTDLTVFPEDEVVFYSQFYVDKNGRELDTIRLKNITGIIKAKNSVTLEEFELDSIITNVSNAALINNNQFISFEQDIIYHIPTVEVRKKLQIKRRSDLDAGGKYYYDFILPELIRWEYWKELATANGAFFDTGQPNNGWNEFWHRYSTLSNWGLYYELKIEATKNETTLFYKFENKIESTNYDTNSDWNPNTIKSYRDSDNTYLFDGSKKYLLGYEDTRIEAEFTKVSGTPTLSEITVNMGIEVFEEGGIEGRRRMSSKYASPSDTWFKSIDLTNKTKLTLSGNTVKATVLINNSEIPLDKKRFKITARLYEIAADSPSKWFQSGDEFIFQGGDTYLFQDQ